LNFTSGCDPHSPPSTLGRQILDATLAVVFPTDCSLCHRELASFSWLRICRRCWGSLEAWEGPMCVRCGLPFPSGQALDSAVAECRACRQDEPAYDAARTFGLYRDKLRQVVLRLKFAGEERLGVRLGQLLALPFAALPPWDGGTAPLVVPVPLHPARRRERGFNQSELLAVGLVRTLAKQGNGALPVAAACLRRTRVTPPQTGLSVAARRENLRGAFAVAKPEAVRGRAVVLVDDVITTGATLSACARTLKRAGAERVLGLALARATPQFPDLGLPGHDDPVDGGNRDSP
jgi:ComF family protein